MRQLFLKNNYILFFVWQFFFVDVVAQEKTLVTNSPEYFSGKVFVGRDSNMPVKSKYVISISPTKDKQHAIVIPENIHDGLIELGNMLPNWYLSALLNNTFEKCSVTVNNQSYSTYIDNWIWVNWMEPENSALRKEFTRRTIYGRELVINAFQFAFCEYMITNDFLKVEDVLNRYKDQRGVRPSKVDNSSG